MPRSWSRRALGPVAILTIGASFCAGVFGVFEAADAREGWTLHRVLNSVVSGAAFGAVASLPVALAEAFRAKLLRLLQPHWFRVQFYLSTMMGVAIGYELSSVRHKQFDFIDGVAWIAVFVGALLKIAMIVIGRDTTPDD